MGSHASVQDSAQKTEDSIWVILITLITEHNLCKDRSSLLQIYGAPQARMSSGQFDSGDTSYSEAIFVGTTQVMPGFL